MAHEARGQVTTISAETGTDVGTYMRTVEDVELPPIVREYANRYDRVIGDRDRFLWKWIHNLFEEFTLSSVSPGALSDVYERKTLLTIFVTVLDDLAERGGDRSTFEIGRRIPFGAEGISDTDPDAIDAELPVLELLADLWAEIDRSLREAPRYAAFSDVFEYDLRQTFDAMEYSGLLNDNPMIANRTEAEQHDAYNMAMFPYAGIDLMHSPSFDREEYGALRSLICDLQQMARIGNWITTWERELAEGDLSSGVVVCALRRGVITPEEVSDADESTVSELIDRIKSRGIESEFVREWEIRNGTVRKRTAEVESVDADAFVDGIQAVMNHHLASEGYK
ncbi:hypothetical protein [Halobellus limi]|jgi:hypothetical protein|uniref:Uncharacterized protein n=1 Tax=Halobellus limi TaxID=699433 RepID=A0A1H6BCZ3_9EURY|nr:hypothetical protein [Halobellus limi]QCC49281.1 hypothetical protein DV707_16170 [Halobellus limi]SEG58502.1 hypothetical protein SAMN04488133_2760 [Halobellus limi]